MNRCLTTIYVFAAFVAFACSNSPNTKDKRTQLDAPTSAGPLSTSAATSSASTASTGTGSTGPASTPSLADGTFSEPLESTSSRSLGSSSEGSFDASSTSTLEPDASAVQTEAVSTADAGASEETSNVTDTGAVSSVTEATVTDATATGGSSAPEPDALPSLLGDVAFSQPSQSFKGTLTVELTSLVEGEIRFTTDGTLPTATSALYESALALVASTELRASVFTDSSPGPVSTALYVARDFDITSDLPLLIVDGYMGGKPTDKETYRRAAFMLFEPVDGVAAFENLPTVATRAGHRLRGQSSQSYAKTPYRVELWGNDGTDADYPLAGMPAEADWALISLYVDRSLVRNAFVYELGRQIGLSAPRVAFAEVYVNQDAAIVTQSHYQGVYNITETIKNSKDRLNLKQLAQDDTEERRLSGGYILSFEYEAVEGTSITCTGSEPFSRGAPGSFTEVPVNAGFCWDDLELRDPEPVNTEQQTWLTHYIQEFHDTLHTDPIGPYADFIDVDSFVDYFLIKELTRDMDAFIRSAYLHKDRDGKLVAGPLWDQDLSLGAGGFFDNLATAGWQIANRRIVHDWFIALTRDPEFLALVGSRWAALREGPFSDENLQAQLAAISAPLANASARDHARWPVSSVRTAASVIQFPAGDTWQAQVDAVGNWLTQRAAWMDGAAGEPFEVPNYPLASP